MATYTKTIKSTGGDYSSLNSWNINEAVSITSGDIYQAECYAFEDTTQVYWAGDWVFNGGGSYLRAFCASGEGHVGVWSTSKYRLVTSLAYWHGSFVSYNVGGAVRVEGLQIHNTYDGPVFYIEAAAAADETRMIRNIMRGNYPTGLYASGITVETNAANTAYIIAVNNVIYGMETGMYFPNGAADQHDLVIYNNTVYGGVNGIYCLGGTTGSSMYLKNNLCSGQTYCYSLQNYTTEVTATNLSSDATSPQTTLRNKTVTFRSGGSDMHLASNDTGASRQGTDLSGDGQYAFSDDMDGATRWGTWDIGADQNYAITAAVGAASISGIAPTPLKNNLVTPSVAVNLGITGYAPTVTIPNYVYLRRYRWVNDDGNEAAASFAAAESTSTAVATEQVIRLRTLLDAVGDPAGKQFQLEYRKVGNSTWIKVT